jgi:hypothetical protein
MSFEIDEKLVGAESFGLGNRWSALAAVSDDSDQSARYFESATERSAKTKGNQPSSRKLRRYINAHSAEGRPILWKYSDPSGHVRR